MKKKRRIRFSDIIRIVVLLVAFSILLYPTISNYWNQIHTSEIVSGYDKAIDEMKEEKKNKLLQEARAYNQRLIGKLGASDPFGKEAAGDELYQKMLNISDTGVMGYLMIPKIKVELPIYHGTEEKVLQVAVGHFSDSSLPVGGKGSHVVLTGHRGLPSARLFTDLDQMEKKDIFYLKVLDETLAYEVDQIKTVLPSDTKDLRIEEDKDQVTLVTCTPYAVNTHRLLIRGHRIPYEEAVEKVADKVDTSIYIPFEVKVLFIGLFVLLLLWLLIWAVRRGKKDGKKKNQ